MTLPAEYNAADSQREIDALQQQLTRMEQFLRLQPLAATPLNPEEGYIAVSDGTGSGFDSVSGAGMYRFDGTAWRHIGTSFSPWTGYTPTVTSSTGTITAVSATGSSFAIGKTVHFQVSVTITTNGTGAGSVDVSLPVTSNTSSFVVPGRDNAVGGEMLQGFIPGSSSTMKVRDFDNTYPGADGSVLILSGVYESA